MWTNAARFDAARETFEVQEGLPTEDYITMIVETIGGVVYTLRYNIEKGKDHLIGIITENPEYVKKFGRSFRRPTHPAVYDDTLGGDKVTIAVRKAEAVHKAKIQDWDLYDTAEEELCRFIIDCVEEMWIAELKKKTTRYAEVKPST